MYFGGAGRITFDKNFAVFTIRKYNELVEVVIPHFEAYPLLTHKWSDFELFRQILLIITVDKNHYTKEGFSRVLSLRYYLNKGISEELKELHPDLVPVGRPVVPEREISPE